MLHKERQVVSRISNFGPIHLWQISFSFSLSKVQDRSPRRFYGSLLCEEPADRGAGIKGLSRMDLSVITDTRRGPVEEQQGRSPFVSFSLPADAIGSPISPLSGPLRSHLLAAEYRSRLSIADKAILGAKEFPFERHTLSRMVSPPNSPDYLSEALSRYSQEQFHYLLVCSDKILIVRDSYYMISCPCNYLNLTSKRQHRFFNKAFYVY